MHFPTLLSNILTLVSLTKAATASIPSSPYTNLYVCTDASWGGTCTNLQLSVSDCHNFTAPYAKKISSAGPDWGTFCTLYTNLNCHGKALPFTNPGIKKLARYGFDDVIQSVRCDFIAAMKDHP